MKVPVNIIIITYNSQTIIGDCIDSILNSKNVKTRITVVDNASADGTVDFIEQKYPPVRIIKNSKNLGYSRAVNIGARSADSEFIIIANADVVFHSMAISQMVSYLTQNDDVGVIGPQQVFPNGSWQRSYGGVPGVRDSFRNLIGITSIHNWRRRLLWPKEVDKYPKQVPYLDGAVLTIRMKAFTSVEGFDEDFFFYAEEADFCHRLGEYGWKVVFFPSAKIIHIRGGSSTQIGSLTEKYTRLQVDSKLHLVKKNYPLWHYRLYIFLEKAHAKKMELIYQVLRFLFVNSKSDHFRKLAASFRLLYEVLNEDVERKY